MEPRPAARPGGAGGSARAGGSATLAACDRAQPKEPREIGQEEEGTPSQNEVPSVTSKPTGPINSWRV